MRRVIIQLFCIYFSNHLPDRFHNLPGDDGGAAFSPDLCRFQLDRSGEDHEVQSPYEYVL